MSKNRSPSAASFGPASGFRPVPLMWSVISISRPGPTSARRLPAALLRITVPQPSRARVRTGRTTSARPCPS